MFITSGAEVMKATPLTKFFFVCASFLSIFMHTWSGSVMKGDWPKTGNRFPPQMSPDTQTVNGSGSSGSKKKKNQNTRTRIRQDTRYDLVLSASLTLHSPDNKFPIHCFHILNKTKMLTKHAKWFVVIMCQTKQAIDANDVKCICRHIQVCMS